MQSPGRSAAWSRWQHLTDVERESSVVVEAALLRGDTLGCAAGAHGGIMDARRERDVPLAVTLYIQQPLTQLDVPA